MFEFVVYGKPQGKARPRVVNGHAFTPKKTKEYETAIKLAFLKRHRGEPRLQGAVCLKLFIGFQIPKAFSKEKHEHALAGWIKPTVKPDIDNIVKAYMDALNGLAWEDDKQVTALYCFKSYEREPRVKVVITEHD